MCALHSYNGLFFGPPLSARALHELIPCVHAEVFGSCASYYDAKWESLIALAQPKLDQLDERLYGKFPALNALRQAVQTPTMKLFDALSMVVFTICEDDAKFEGERVSINLFVSPVHVLYKKRFPNPMSRIINIMSPALPLLPLHVLQ